MRMRPRATGRGRSAAKAARERWRTSPPHRGKEFPQRPIKNSNSPMADVQGAIEHTWAAVSSCLIDIISSCSGGTGLPAHTDLIAQEVFYIAEQWPLYKENTETDPSAACSSLLPAEAVHRQSSSQMLPRLVTGVVPLSQACTSDWPFSDGKASAKAFNLGAARQAATLWANVAAGRGAADEVVVAVHMAAVPHPSDLVAHILPTAVRGLHGSIELPPASLLSVQVLLQLGALHFSLDRPQLGMLAFDAAFEAIAAIQRKIDNVRGAELKSDLACNELSIGGVAEAVVQHTLTGPARILSLAHWTLRTVANMLDVARRHELGKYLDNSLLVAPFGDGLRQRADEPGCLSPVLRHLRQLLAEASARPPTSAYVGTPSPLFSVDKTSTPCYTLAASARVHLRFPKNVTMRMLELERARVGRFIEDSEREEALQCGRWLNSEQIEREFPPSPCAMVWGMLSALQAAVDVWRTDMAKRLQDECRPKPPRTPKPVGQVRALNILHAALRATPKSAEVLTSLADVYSFGLGVGHHWGFGSHIYAASAELRSRVKEACPALSPTGAKEPQLEGVWRTLGTDLANGLRSLFSIVRRTLTVAFPWATLEGQTHEHGRNHNLDIDVGRAEVIVRRASRATPSMSQALPAIQEALGNPGAPPDGQSGQGSLHRGPAPPHSTVKSYGLDIAQAIRYYTAALTAQRHAAQQGHSSVAHLRRLCTPRRLASLKFLQSLDAPVVALGQSHAYAAMRLGWLHWQRQDAVQARDAFQDALDSFHDEQTPSASIPHLSTRIGAILAEARSGILSRSEAELQVGVTVNQIVEHDSYSTVQPRSVAGSLQNQENFHAAMQGRVQEQGIATPETSGSDCTVLFQLSAVLLRQGFASSAKRLLKLAAQLKARSH